MTPERKTRIVKLAQERKKSNLGKVLGVTAGAAGAGAAAGWGLSKLPPAVKKLSPAAQKRFALAAKIGLPIAAGSIGLALALRDEKRKQLLGQ